MALSIKTSSWFFMRLKVFSPNNWRAKFALIAFNVSFSPLKRDEKDFYNHITKLIDLIEKTNPPEFSEDCSLCQFTEINSNL